MKPFLMLIDALGILGFGWLAVWEVGASSSVLSDPNVPEWFLAFIFFGRFVQSISSFWTAA